MSIVNKILKEVMDIQDTYEYTTAPLRQKGPFEVFYAHFATDSGIDIKVDISRSVLSDEEKFEVAWSANNSIEKGDANMSYKEYIKTLTTIAKISEEFIKQYEPDGLWFGGDKQKIKIYNYLLSKISTNYKKRQVNGFVELLNPSVLQEAMMPVEPLFDQNIQERYGFIWRDVTNFNTIDKKRDIVKKMEGYIKNGGMGLPTVEIDPNMLVATQKSVSTDKIVHIHQDKKRKHLPKPFVVKLNMVYYLLDGHHRTAEAKLAGEKYLKVKLLDLDQYNNVAS